MFFDVAAAAVAAEAAAAEAAATTAATAAAAVAAAAAGACGVCVLDVWCLSCHCGGEGRTCLTLSFALMFVCCCVDPMIIKQCQNHNNISGKQFTYLIQEIPIRNYKSETANQFQSDTCAEVQ